jgi:ABC-type lipoprotein export system ATPase subunit
VTHDQEVANRTQRTIRLRDGQVIDSVLSGTDTPHRPHIPLRPTAAGGT